MKGKIAFIVFLGCACFAQGNLALAQIDPPLGSIPPRHGMAVVPDAPKMSKGDRVRAVTVDYADCVVNRREKDARNFVAAPYGSSDSLQMMQRMNDGRCLLNAQLKIPYVLIRGAVFKVLYIKDFSAVALVSSETAADYTSMVADSSSVNGALQVMMLDFAGCVIKSYSDEVKSLLLAKVGSAQEKRAFSALIPVMGPCFPEGQKAEFNKGTLTAVFAEAMYRKSQASVANVSATSGNK